MDPELAALISRALEFSEISGGAFDITYASVGYLYDYRDHHPPERLPDPGGAARRSTGATSWWISAASTIRFTQPGVRIDLGGIAKGYAVDQPHRILARRAASATRR